MVGVAAAVGAAGMAVVESAPDAMLIVDGDGRIVVANTMACRLFGYEQSELIGSSVDVLVPHRLGDSHAEHRAKYAMNPHSRTMGSGPDLVAVRKDGSEFAAEISLGPFDTPAGTLVVSTVRDVSLRKESETLFRGLLEAAPDAMIIVDARGLIVLVNAQAERLFGYTREQLVDQPVEMLVPADLAARHMADRTGFMDDPRARQMGSGLDLMAQHRDGSAFPVEISLSPLHTESGILVSAAVRDVTDRRRAWDAAERARGDAELANRAKSEFLSRMSHELRTPLNAILGFGQLLELQELSTRQDESVRQIMKAGRHLLNLIDEVLDITRIEAGHLPVSPEPVHVDMALSEAIELVRPLATAKGVELGGSGDGADHYVLADRQRLRQVLLNLLSNAVKYNRPGGVVSVAYEAAPGDRLRLAVTDTGPGIASSFFDRMFRPFERLGAEGTGVEGTGLGLALSKGLVEAMGGTLDASSVLGEGSTFWVELPVVAGPLDALEHGHSLQVPAGSDTRPTCTILSIEDNISNLRLIERVLELRPRVELLSAMQASIGLELAQQHHPDLILLDLHLPDMRGEEALWHLLNDPATSDIPVVIVSADATPGQVERLKEAGAFAYLTKPLDVHSFLDLVDETLERP
jgi:protein-histidine pros-kinase